MLGQVFQVKTRLGLVRPRNSRLAMLKLVNSGYVRFGHDSTGYAKLGLVRSV
jgi:hypothetical protein